MNDSLAFLLISMIIIVVLIVFYFKKNEDEKAKHHVEKYDVGSCRVDVTFTSRTFSDQEVSKLFPGGEEGLSGFFYTGEERAHAWIRNCLKQGYFQFHDRYYYSREQFVKVKFHNTSWIIEIANCTRSDANDYLVKTNA